MCVDVCIYVYMCIYIYIYIYVRPHLFSTALLVQHG